MVVAAGHPLLGCISGSRFIDVDFVEAEDILANAVPSET